MSYPNEHACRLLSPGMFKQCRRSQRRSEGKVYGVITCEKKNLPGRWSEQAFRYNKNEWSPEAAKAHCKRHQGRFEAARELVKFSDLPEMKLVKKRSKP